MHVSHLSLTDFRSYHAVELALAPGVTTFIGPNGHGKTNLIEAVGYLATLGSHRVATDAPLVRLGAERAVIRAQVVRSDRRMLVELEIAPGRGNRARLNRAPVRRPAEVLGVLRIVLFAPEDLALVKGEPAQRRQFLDDLLVARTPRLAAVRQDYDRVLRQRNALLKSAAVPVRAGRRELPTLDVWDAQLARTGAELLAARLELVEALRPLVAASYDVIAAARIQGPGPADLSYRSSVATGAEAVAPVDRGRWPVPADRTTLSELLLASLLRARPAELERGVTLVGPHRDDLDLQLGAAPARGYASHGESWSLALAMRLASYDLLCAESDPGGGKPVLLLDDVFAELDVDRRQRLARLVAGAEQVLVTAAVPESVPDVLAGGRVDVLAGDVRRAG